MALRARNMADEDWTSLRFELGSYSPPQRPSELESYSLDGRSRLEAYLTPYQNEGDTQSSTVNLGSARLPWRR